MTSEIRVNKINNRAGLGTVEYTPTGIIVSGIVTAYEFDGNFDTTPGIVVTGIATAAGIDLNGDLDVDGHTNLDNLSVAGVSTFSSNITLNGGLVASSTVNAGQILVGTGVTIEANQVATGQATFTGIVTASHFYGNGANLTALNASNISSGTVPSARLGSGTASSSTFLAGDSTFKTVTGTTINNNADNRLITGSGSANTLNAESNLTFDGTTLQVENSGSGLRNLLRLKNSNASAGVSGLYFNSTTSGTAFDAACVRNGVNGSGQGRLYLQTNNGSGLVTNLNIEYDGQVSIPTNSLNIIDSIIHIGDTNTKIRFPADDTFTVETAGSERLRIDSNGHLLLGTTTGGLTDYGDSLTIADANAGMTLRAAATNQASHIYFADGTSGDAQYRGYVQYHHNADLMKFGTAATERLRIVSNGHVAIGDDIANDTGMFKVIAADGQSDDQYVGQFKNLEATTNRNWGLLIQAGSSSTDESLRVRNGANNADQLTIRGDGVVTKPRQPSFTARSSGTWTHGSSTGYLDIDINMIELFDIGGNYNHSTGVFTAPVAGKYFFSYTFQYKCTSGYLVVTLRKGVSGSYSQYGNMVVYPPQQSTVYTGPGIIGIMDLAAGNTVRPNAEVNYAGNQIANVNFSGYLLG